MNILLYIVIFASKVFENALGTLRLIVVANGKKTLGAILQGLIGLVWIIVTSVVVVGVTEDPIKVIAFALGSAVGSYLGSVLEQKIALGSNMLMAIVDQSYGEIIATEIRNNGFAVTVLDAKGMDKERNVLMVVVVRKKRRHVVEIIKEKDKEAMIVSENTFTLYGGYHK
ncbi:MAG: DUF5698 domain-containing protein [Bacilli bacterium]|nr:DUF5698 domain-containing protein [Bacilli bacterium]MDD4809419.1 DUF5698 domain-containing protein [Bacilli bacterium]